MGAVLVLMTLVTVSPGSDGIAALTYPAGRNHALTQPPEERAITVTVVETWPVTFTSGHIVDLDWIDHDPFFDLLAVTAPADDKIYLLYPATGVAVASIDMRTGYSSPCGMACTNDDSHLYVVNDESDTWIWAYSASDSSWSHYMANPAGDFGTGLAWDGESGYFWEAYTSGSSGRLYRFTGGASTQFNLPQCPTCWALAIYPYDSNLGIMVCGLSTDTFHFYEYAGASLSYVGSAPRPSVPAFSMSTGLTYSNPTLDCFFWGWRDYGDQYYISRLEVDFTAGLEPATWGAVKTLL